MPSIVPNVSFDTIAREWRCKWDSEDALSAAQDALTAILDEVKSVKGVKSVQRVVCGGCKDFKVIVSLEEPTFGEWEQSTFAPETSFLEKLKGIDGINTVETQTYTLMTV